MIEDRNLAIPPTLSVLIPAYSEEKTITEVLTALWRLQSERQPFALDIVVISDGSTDGTVTAVSAFIANHPARTDRKITCIALPINQGKSAALQVDSAGFATVNSFPDRRYSLNLPARRSILELCGYSSSLGWHMSRQFIILLALLVWALGETLPAQEIDTLRLTLSRGWNLVGIPHTVADSTVSPDLFSPTGCLVGSAYWYDDTAGTYRTTDRWQPLKGHWLLLATPGTLLLPVYHCSPTPPPPPSNCDCAHLKWRAIPAGTFSMGQDTSRWPFYAAYEEPPHPVTLGLYMMASTEVPNRCYWEFILSGGYRDSTLWEIDDGSVADPWIGWRMVRTGRLEAPAEWDLALATPWTTSTGSPDECMPVVGESWYEAWAFAKWMSRTLHLSVDLPTEAQWERAARGPNPGRQWPWGNAWDSSRCNHGSGWGAWDAADGYDGTTAPVETFSTLDGSVENVYDLAGNAWEWVRDWFSEGTYARTVGATDPYWSTPAEYRGLRGGCYDVGDRYTRSAFRHLQAPANRWQNIGIRLVIQFD